MFKNYLKFQRKGRNNLNTEYQQEEEIISLTELFSLLKRHFLKIAGAGLVCAILGFTVTQFIIKPVYEARAKMIVNTRQNQTGIVTNDQINSAKNLVDTYAVIIRSRAILQPIIDNFDMNPEFPKNYNVFGGVTPNDLYRPSCFFVTSPTRMAFPGFSNASMTSSSSRTSCMV